MYYRSRKGNVEIESLLGAEGAHGLEKDRSIATARAGQSGEGYDARCATVKVDGARVRRRHIGRRRKKGWPISDTHRRQEHSSILVVVSGGPAGEIEIQIQALKVQCHLRLDIAGCRAPEAEVIGASSMIVAKRPIVESVLVRRGKVVQ